MSHWVPRRHFILWGDKFMRIWGNLVVAAAALVASQVGFGLHPAAATTSHPGGVSDTCPEVLAGRPTGGLEKVTEPPAETGVHPGEVISVSLRWEPGTFDRPVLHKAIDCVTVDGQLLTDVSVQERDTANDGLFEFAYTVPDGLAAGTRLCDRGFVSGSAGEDAFDREKSNDVCFTVRAGAAGAPEPAAAVVPVPVPTPAAPAAPAPVDTSPPTLDTQLGALGGLDTQLDALGGPDTTRPAAETISPLPDTSTMAPPAPASAPVEAVGESLPRTGVAVRTGLLLGLAFVLGGLMLRQFARTSMMSRVLSAGG